MVGWTETNREKVGGGKRQKRCEWNQIRPGSLPTKGKMKGSPTPSQKKGVNVLDAKKGHFVRWQARFRDE